MDLMWQICELEDNYKSFIRFTVSAVPENWIVKLENGLLVCYWPKVNPGRKIRSLQQPEVDGGKWTYYKCRILMNGDKFSTYEEAKEAEKIAQNFSSMSEFENAGACDSTMQFDVSDVSDVSDVDTDEIDTNEMEMVGNDSFDFNKAILKGGAYCSKKAAEPDEILSRTNRTDSNIPEMSDYSSLFQSNKVGFLTSTLLGETEILRNIEESDDTKILSKISTIEKNISFFVVNTQKDLCELKEVVRSTVKKPEKDKQDEVFVLQSEQTNMNSLAVDLSEANQEQEKENEQSFLNDENVAYDVSNVQLTNVKVLNVEILNEPDPITQEVALNGETLNAAVLTSEEVLNAPIPIANEIPNDETFVANSPQAVVVLPITRKCVYERNEDLLDETAMEDALVEHLLPLDDEDEVTYMNRTVLKVFTPNFFIDSVTMRPEKDENRVLIKNSHLLHCWQESFGRKFKRGVNDAKFTSHFRRMKSAKRAARKAEKEKMAKRSGKR